MSGLEFASFWRGSLEPFEQACLRSFVVRGYSITLYSYELLENVPDGVNTADARRIAPEASAQRFIYGGRPNLSHFSDYFRYNLSLKTDQIWVDTDLLAVRTFPETLPASIIAREDASMICPAILRLDSNDPRLPQLIAATEKKMDRELIWAETGPKLMTAVIGADAVRAAYPPEIFFPIHHSDFWRVFLPSQREWCEAATRSAVAVHLWNNIVTSLGVWKQLGPPVGSYLHNCFAADGSLDLFSAFYPPEVMEQMIENYRLRASGGALGIGAIARQTIPSIGRSWRSRFG